MKRGDFWKLFHFEMIKQRLVTCSKVNISSSIKKKKAEVSVTVHSYSSPSPEIHNALEMDFFKFQMSSFLDLISIAEIMF